MSVIYINGLETGSLDSLDFVSAVASGADVSLSDDTPGPWSRYSCRLSGSASCVSGVTIPGGLNDFYFGFYFKVSIPLSGGAHDWIEIIDPLGNSQCEFRLSTAGVITAWRGDAATLLATSTETLAFNKWHHAAGRVFVADASGRMIFKVDGRTFIDFTGDTKANATDDDARQLRFASRSSGEPRWWDDLVLDNAAEPEELGVMAIRPMDDGDTIQLNRSPTSVSRFYFPYPDESAPLIDGSGPAEIKSLGSELESVAPDTSWERLDTLSRGKLVGQSTDSELLQGGHQSGTLAAAGISQSNLDHLLGQWISDPIAAQTISGTVKGQFLARETGTGLDARAQVVIRVVSNDGSVVRGTLVASDTGALASEFSTTLQNREFPRNSPFSMSSVVCSDGDRIVVEIGFRAHGNTVNSGELRVGVSSDGTDLPEDETTGDTGGVFDNPWLEFENAITMHTENYNVMDDFPNPDDDASYVAETTQNDRDLYQLEDIGSEWTNVAGVMMWVRARETEPGATKMAHGVKNGGTTSDGSDIALTPEYAWHYRMMAVDPTDAAAWTRTKVNSLQAGPKVR